MTESRIRRSLPRGRLLAGAGAAAASWAVVTAPAKAAQFEFKCGSNAAVLDPRTVRTGQMWAAVQRESGGRVAIQYYPASSLGSEDAMFSQLRLGALHFQEISPGTISTAMPVWNLPYIGFAFRDVPEATRVLTGPLGTFLSQEATAKGIHVCPGLSTIGMAQVCASTRVVHTPDDLAGLKLRVANNKISVDFFKLLGASPTPLTTTEVYPGLQTKLIDGVSSAITFIVGVRWDEVIHHISITNHAWNGNRIIANGEVWKSLPDDIKAIIERNTAKYSDLATKDVMENESAVQKRLQANGMTFNTVDQTPFRARIGPYFREWAGIFGPTAWNLLQDGLHRRLA